MPVSLSHSHRPTTRTAQALLVFASLLALLSGCSTPGPNHAYVAATAADPILDLAKNQPSTDVSTHLFLPVEVCGIAYDPFTDHLFVRLPPGNFVRVIDRPARRVKYDFTASGVPATGGGGDIAIRSRDRDLFFAHPSQPVLIETTLYGDHVRDIRLQYLSTAPEGVAYDQKLDRFYILVSGRPATVKVYALDGHLIGALTLDHAVVPVSLAFDSVAREFYAPLDGEPAIGVFDAKGRLLRKLPIPAAPAYEHVDVGARSFLRLF